MQKIKTVFVAVFVALSFAFFAMISSAQITDVPIPDCTQWNIKKVPEILYFNRGTVAIFQTTDLVVGTYNHPEHNGKCTRFFLQNTGQMIWQLWQVKDGTYFASILLEDGTYYTVENAITGSRQVYFYSDGINDFVRMNFGILAIDTGQYIRRRSDSFRMGKTIVREEI